MATQVTLGFGIRVNGHDAGMTFPILEDAEDNVERLLAHGYKQLEIFRRMGDQAQLRSRS